MRFLESVKSIKLKDVCVSDFRRTYPPFSNGCMKNAAMKAPPLIKGFRTSKVFAGIFKRKMSCRLEFIAEYAKLQGIKMKG